MSNSVMQVRRALTDTEIATLAVRITNATSLSELVDTAVRGLFDILLADQGCRFDDFDRDHPLDPQRFSVPSIQWQALAGAVTSRADQWGAAATIGLELVSIWPGTFEDPAVPEPQLTVVDRRPQQFDIHVSRDAADEIAKCEDHLSSLADYYGATSAHYLDALRSWHRLVVGLFATRRGGDIIVTRDGRLSLLINCDHLTYAAIFHGRRRTCTDTACHATASDDGTWGKPHDSAAILAHGHTPSYPFGAPQPGDWSFHS